MSVRHPRLSAFLRKRISQESYFGLHLTVGLVFSALLAWLFASIAEDVLTKDPLVRVDGWVVTHVHYLRHPVITAVMRAFTRLGGKASMTLGSVFMAAVLLMRKQFDALIGFVAAMAGGSFLVALLKWTIHRPRPDAEKVLIESSGWSFPSGHSASSAIFMGMAVYFLLFHIRSLRSRVVLLSIASLVVFMIGLSRIYLQVHYLSDVLAGYAGGLAYLAFCITGLDVFRKRREKEHDKPVP